MDTDALKAAATFCEINCRQVRPNQEKGGAHAVAAMREFMSFISRANAAAATRDHAHSNYIVAPVCGSNNLDLPLQSLAGVPQSGVLSSNATASGAILNDQQQQRW
jgi:hypothetical protein